MPSSQIWKLLNQGPPIYTPNNIRVKKDPDSKVRIRNFGSFHLNPSKHPTIYQEVLVRRGRLDGNQQTCDSPLRVQGFGFRVTSWGTSTMNAGVWFRVWYWERAGLSCNLASFVFWWLGLLVRVMHASGRALLPEP